VTRVNEFGQPIGDDLGRWTPPLIPEHVDRVGQYVRLEPLQRARHSIPLFHTFTFAEDTLWTYLPLGPFGDAADIGQLIDSMNRSPETQPYAVIVENEVHGFLSYLRMQPDVGVIEIGWVTFSPMIQRTRASTEAITLLLEHAFSSGYRRVEWKGDSLNQASRNAAERYGFRYEGTFAKATHYKGRSRDTAWFAMTDDDWVDNGRRLQAWLSPDNFDADGTQRMRLGDIA
jgi:RimJ/RimL family protein N-acetyltransferase